MDDTSVDHHRADVNEDDWRHVTDAKRRKQIQDRLAQRARRKRLRDAKRNTKETVQGPEEQSNNDMQADFQSRDVSIVTPGLVSPDAIDLIPDSSEITMPLTSQQSPSICYCYMAQAPTLSHELPFQPTVFTALYINGRILGLSCCTIIPARSLPVSSDVPLPLQPTPTQLLTIHSPGIDRFPFPKMRDNVINMSAIINEEEFSCDLFTKPSFSIKPGAATWDPRAWKVDKDFADKWGFLFY